MGQVSGLVCHTNGIRGYGNPNAQVMVIGIAPGRDEVKKGMPFTGPSGRLLDSMLRAVGLQREDIYATNLICWYKDAPTHTEIKQCYDRLVTEILQIKPKVIYLLGAIVTEYMIGRKLGGIHGCRGAVIWNNVLETYLIPTYHPAGILRSLDDRSRNKNTELQYDFYRDLRKHSFVTRWAANSPHAQITYQIISSPEYLQSVIDSQSDGDIIALDVETYNPEPDQIDVWGDSLLCFSIATKDHAWVVPLEVINCMKGECDCTHKHKPISWQDDRLRYTFHNAQFDTQIVYKNLGQWIEVKEDTMLMSYSLDERGGIHGLKPLAREYLGAGWWEEARQKNKKRLSEIPREQLYEYNAKDSVYTARLAHWFKPQQIQDDVRGVYENILIPAVNCVKEIQFRGMRISKRKHMQFAIEWGQMYVDLEEKLKKQAYEYGWTGEEINLQGPAQVSKFLFNILSLPVGKRSDKTGMPSTDMEVLKELSDLHPFVPELIRYRHMARYYDTYILGMQRHIKDDSRVHPYVKIHGARTGRWSYGDPPMQTIPQTYEKEGVEEDFQETRQMFIPSSKDYVFLEVDYGKGEIWCAQAQSGDLQMKADLLSADYHSTTASNVRRKALEDVTKEDRFLMKKVTFGVMYFEEARSLSKQIKTTTLEAQLYIDRFFERNPAYRKYFLSIIDQVKKVGELVSITGRKRRFLILDSGVRAFKQAVNYPIQSALGDLTELALIKLHTLFKEKELRAYVLLQVHDSLLFEVHKDDLPTVLPLVHEIMVKGFYSDWPRLPVEMGVGSNWGQIKPIHDCMSHDKNEWNPNEECNIGQDNGIRTKELVAI